MNRFITTLLISLILCVPARSFSIPEKGKEEQSFSSVEERRIHASIQEEREILLDRKKELSLKENELKTLEEAVDKKIAELDAKLEKLKKSKQELAELLRQKDEAEQAKIQSLSKIYEKMDPVKAALAISGLEHDLAARLLANMKVKAAAKILNNLNKPKATEISTIFSTIQLE